MQPTNEQVVAACQRAGISVYASQFYDGLVVTSKSNEGYPIYPSDDNYPGSALFIVAVMSRFETVKTFDYGNALPADRRFAFNGYRYPNGTEVVHGGEGPTLTAACMAAIVAAFPAEGKA